MTMIIALVFLIGSGYHAVMGNWNAAIWCAFMCSIFLNFRGQITIVKSKKGTDEHP